MVVRGRARSARPASRGRAGLGAAVLAGAALATLAMAASAAAAIRPPFSHEGRWITDRSGRVVILHGVNMVNKLPPYHPASLGFSEDDVRFLAREGFNTVRLGIIHKGLEPSPGGYDDAYLGQVAETARMAARNGVYPLVDFHQDMYNERFNGEGEPDWSVHPDCRAIPAEPDVGFPGNYSVMPALWCAYDRFWLNQESEGTRLQDAYAAAWRHAASAFRGQRGVVGFDIFNEPWAGTQWPTCANPDGCRVFDQTQLTPFSTRVFAAIRQADRRRLLFYEPQITFNNGADTHHGDTGDSRAGMSFHLYCLGETPGALEPRPEGQQGCSVADDRVFEIAERQTRETNDALLLTEFGATDATFAIERVAEAADRHMVGWQEWSYWNRDPCCARPYEGLIHDISSPPSGDNVKQDKLAVLTRPTPGRSRERRGASTTTGTPAGSTSSTPRRVRAAGASAAACARR